MSETKPKFSEIDWDQVAQFRMTMDQVAYLKNGSTTSGSRTIQRNKQVGGHPDSKHTFHGGWGMAQDFMFDTPKDRQEAVHIIEEAGYYTFHGSNYHPCQLHVQGWKVGEKPSWPLKVETEET